MFDECNSVIDVLVFRLLSLLPSPTFSYKFLVIPISVFSCIGFSHERQNAANHKSANFAMNIKTLQILPIFLRKI